MSLLGCCTCNISLLSSCFMLAMSPKVAVNEQGFMPAGKEIKLQDNN